MKIIVVTFGYFNPIHPGHIECFELCKKLGLIGRGLMKGSCIEDGYKYI